MKTSTEQYHGAVITPPHLTRRTVHAADLDLGGNRTCRVGIECGPEGPEALTLMMGWYAGPEFRGDRHEGVSLPGEKIGPLRAILCALVLEASGCEEEGR